MVYMDFIRPLGTSTSLRLLTPIFLSSYYMNLSIKKAH